jgi:hypothetical protein
MLDILSVSRRKSIPKQPHDVINQQNERTPFISETQQTKEHQICFAAGLT